MSNFPTDLVWTIALFSSCFIFSYAFVKLTSGVKVKKTDKSAPRKKAQPVYYVAEQAPERDNPIVLKGTLLTQRQMEKLSLTKSGGDKSDQPSNRSPSPHILSR